MLHSHASPIMSLDTMYRTCRVSLEETAEIKEMAHLGWMMWRGYLWIGWTVFRDSWCVRIVSIRPTIWYRLLIPNPSPTRCLYHLLPSPTFITFQRALSLIPISLSVLHDSNTIFLSFPRPHAPRIAQDRNPNHPILLLHLKSTSFSGACPPAPT